MSDVADTGLTLTVDVLDPSGTKAGTTDLPAELFEADGAWLVSSVRGAAPMLRLDGRELPHDAKLSAKLAKWAGF